MTDTEPQGYACTVSGCDWGDGESKAKPAIRAHISNSGAEDHDWAEQKPRIEAQNPPLDSSEEADESTDSDEDEDEDTDMATQAEYEAQHDQDGEKEATGNDSDGGVWDTLSSIPTTYLLIGAALVAVALYVQYGGSDNDNAGELPDPDSTDSDESTQTDSSSVVA